MRNQIYRAIAILGVVFGLAVAGVQAQAPSRVEVNIPFEFTAGKTTLKPGMYSIRRLSGERLALRSGDGKSTVILNAPINMSSSDINSVERLVFDKCEDQYFLSQIWLTADTGREIPVRRRAAKPERVELSLLVK